jgi:hypothetical protein
MCYLGNMLKLRFLPLLALFCALPASADIYKLVDEHGNVTYTNTPARGAKRILAESPAPHSSAKTRNSSKAQAATPANFPKVSSGKQKERDLNRRRILEEELASERRILATQKKELAEAENTRSAGEQGQQYIERIGRMRENLVLHERNISALQTELTKIR